MKNGWILDIYIKTIKHFVNDQIHGEGFPAGIDTPSGDRGWYKNDLYWRLNGYASVCNGGNRGFYQNGERIFWSD